VLSAPRAAIPGERVMFTHAILLDGQLIGHWRPVSKKSAVVVEASFYRTLDRVEAQALEAAVERYGRFLGVPAEVM
jgi:hypothetical protein